MGVDYSKMWSGGGETGNIFRKLDLRKKEVFQKGSRSKMVLKFKLAKGHGAGGKVSRSEGGHAGGESPGGEEKKRAPIIARHDVVVKGKRACWWGGEGGWLQGDAVSKTCLKVWQFDCLLGRSLRGLFLELNS